METVALIISIIAVIISVGIPIYEKTIDKRVNDINLNSEYLKEIYILYLTKEIPRSRKIMRFKHNVLCDTNDFCNTLKSFLCDIQFYMYIDKYFYNRLKQVIQELEDFVMEADGATLNDNEKNDFWDNIDTYLNSIYNLMNQKYINGRVEEI